MVKLTKLTTREQLENLKKNDRLLVQWSKKHSEVHRIDEITMTKIYGINSLNEVIVRIKDNLYFSIDMLLEVKSCAKEAYLVED